MFKKALFAIATLIGCTTAANANIWIEGSVFTETSDSTLTYVPFATMTFYDADNHEDQKYFTVTNEDGLYMLNPYEHSKPYYIEVSAPGYDTRRTTIQPLPEKFSDGRPFDGNMHIAIKLNASGEAPAMAKTTYKGDSLAKDAKNVKELILATVSGIQNEGNDWFTDNDGSVIIFINKFPFESKLIGMLDQIPADAIDQIDLIKLPEGSIYECALRINIPQFPSNMLPEITWKEKDNSLLSDK